MDIKIVRQNVELGDEREAYIRQKFEKLGHLGHRIGDESSEIRVELEHQPTKSASDAYSCKLTLFVPGDTLRAEAHSDSLEDAVDEVIEKIKAPIERYKDKVHHISDRHSNPE